MQISTRRRRGADQYYALEARADGVDWSQVADTMLRVKQSGLNRTSVAQSVLDAATKNLPSGSDRVFFQGMPQRNRNEIGETTVNKTRRKRLPHQENSTTYKILTAFGTQERPRQIET